MVESSRSHLKEGPTTLSILIYRNSDDQIHSIPIEDFEKRLGISYTDSLIFDSPKTIDKIAKKCAKKLKQEKWRQMNAWTLALHEKAMDKPHKDLIYIRWINRYLGYGVFAARDIPALSFIGEYTGVIQRRNNRKDRFNDYVFSYDLCGKSTRWSIDAKEKGNFTRFLNHSDKPNLTSRWVIKDGLTRIIFFANKSIPKGAQLTYCYGPLYWRSRTSPSSL